MPTKPKEEGMSDLLALNVIKDSSLESLKDRRPKDIEKSRILAQLGGKPCKARNLYFKNRKHITAVLNEASKTFGNFNSVEWSDMSGDEYDCDDTLSFFKRTKELKTCEDVRDNEGSYIDFNYIRIIEFPKLVIMNIDLTLEEGGRNYLTNMALLHAILEANSVVSNT